MGRLGTEERASKIAFNPCSLAQPRTWPQTKAEQNKNQHSPGKVSVLWPFLWLSHHPLGPGRPLRGPFLPLWGRWSQKWFLYSNGLTGGRFCPAGNRWQHLETFWVVPTGEGELRSVIAEAGDAAKHPTGPSSTIKYRPVQNVNSTEGEKLWSTGGKILILPPELGFRAWVVWTLPSF